jgi:predicted metal-dependent enzyme (double-stranded beta helix superfamily)
VQAVLADAMQRPGEVADRLQPDTAGMTLLHHSPQLTILDVVWAPHMTIAAHDHGMWAVVAIYAGREDNQFFHRVGARLNAAGRRRVVTGEVMMLEGDAVHGVSNPDARPTGAIHVYGGDFINQPRSQWVPPALTEEPYDAANVARVFAEANSAWNV